MVPNVCTVSQTDGTNSDAGRLGDPAGHFSGGLPCSAVLCFGHPGDELPLLWLVLALFPPEQGSFLPAEGPSPMCRYPLIPREAWGDAGRCPQAHPKQKDLSSCPTPLSACCRSLELVLLGKVVGFVCGLKSKTRIG